MVTVKDLIEQLQKLPQETIVYEMTWKGIDALSVLDDVFRVYQKDQEIKLFIDDREAFHPEDDFCTNIFDLKNEVLKNGK